MGTHGRSPSIPLSLLALVSLVHCGHTATPCGDAACAADGTPPFDAPLDGPSEASEGGAPSGSLGAPCTSDRDCASGVCLSVGRCSEPCTMRSDCPTGSNWMCAGVPGRGTICVCASSGGSEVACNGVDEDCDGVTDPHQATCDGACTDLWSSDTNCGGCGVLCAGASVCVDGACACPTDRPTVCGTMCTDTMHDPMHCGGCTTVCPAVANGTAACVMGACTATCAAGFGDCDGSAGSGCETDVRADAANCGACGRACAFAHASATCSTGTCVMGACAAGYGDCDASSLDGCEAAIASDAANCGACGHACAAANATVACSAGACSLTGCTMGHGDCDRAAANGCEVDLQNDPLDCGACGGRCPGASAPHTLASCSAGACGSACASGFGDCDGDASNGCETALDTSAHCGSCTTACPGTQVCSGGVCSTCAAGETLCGGVCATCGARGCGSSFSESMDTAPVGWSFVGDARYDATAHTAVVGSGSGDGALWFNDAMIPDGMVASFRFRISTHPDGMAFAIQQTGPTAFGIAGGGLRVAGLTGYGVEMDVYNNAGCGDVDDDHIAVDSLATCGPGTYNIPTTLQATPALSGLMGLYLADSSWHQCTVRLDSGAMSVDLDGHSLLTSVPLPGYVAGASYYFGFAAAGSHAEVRDVSITFPTPRCL